MSSKTLEGMARASYEKATSRNSKQMPADYYLEAPDYRAAWEEEMKAALLWLADQVEENGDAVKDCKLAAVSAYLERGQEGRAMVEPVRLMKAISAALRAAGDGR